jgi:hypothetical protein
MKVSNFVLGRKKGLAWEYDYLSQLALMLDLKLE